MKFSSLVISSLLAKTVHVDGRCKFRPVEGHVDWPSSLKIIKKNAFKNCKQLRSIYIPPEVKSIHNTAFANSGLDLSELQNCVADPSPLLFLKGPRQIERLVEAEPAVVLADPPINYIFSFTIEPKGIVYGNGKATEIIRVAAGDNFACCIPSVSFSYETTKLIILTAHDENSLDYHYMNSALDIDTEYEVAVEVFGMTSTVSINGVVKSTKSIGTRQKFDEASFYIGGYKFDDAANAIISNISYDKHHVSSTFNFKGPLKIKRSVKGEPAAVLAAPPTDYNLEFIIEPKSITEHWGSIILLTTGDYYYPGYPYGTMVPAVTMRYGTTLLEAYIGHGTDGHPSLSSKPLEVDKKSKVVIKVYGTTATISVNGVIEDEITIGARSQLNDVELYIGSPWSDPANSTVSDISFG